MFFFFFYVFFFVDFCIDFLCFFRCIGIFFGMDFWDLLTLFGLVLFVLPFESFCHGLKPSTLFMFCVYYAYEIFGFPCPGVFRDFCSIKTY